MEIIFELILQIIAEGFGELLVRGFGRISKKSRTFSIFAALIGYGLLSALLGSLTIPFFRNHLIQNPTLRLISLFLTPCLIGALMHLRGKNLKRHNKLPINIDSFGFGFYFAFIFGLIRFFFAN